MTERITLPDLNQLNPEELKTLIVAQQQQLLLKDEQLASRDSEIEQLRLSLFCFPFLTGKRADNFALPIENLKPRRLFRRFLQVVVQDRAVRRVLADGITTRIEMTHPRPPRCARNEEMRVSGCDRNSGLPQRANIIEHPERAPVRGDGEVIIMNNHVMDRRVRKIELERLPIRAIVEGNPNSRFSSSLKQSSALRVFAHGVNVRIVG